MAKNLLDYMPEYVEALTAQLKSDEERWGDTWKHRPREGQIKRLIDWFRDKRDQYLHGGQPFPILKLGGEAFILWIRENHPDFADA